MTVIRSSIVRMAIVALGLALGGCAAAPPKPAATHAQLIASADINPDATGRPSPVVVRLYQLSGESAFQNADFFSLWDHERATLGSSRVQRTQRTIFPGENVALTLPLAAATRFLAVAAAYRDVRAAHWRALVGIPKKSLLKLLAHRRVTVRVGKDAVSIAITD